MTDTIHSCGYHCRIPACVLVQRDELVAKYVAQPVQPTESEKHSFVRSTLKHHGITHHVHTALVADLIYGLEALAQPLQPAEVRFGTTDQRMKLLDKATNKEMS